MNVQDLPEPLLVYIDLFNNGQFFESHEVLEGAWLENSSDFYQGLIIYAAAYVKRDWGNPRGVVRNFNKALNYLRPYRPAYLGLDVTALVTHAETCLAALAAEGVTPGPASGDDDPAGDPAAGVTAAGGPAGDVAARLQALVPSILLEPVAHLIQGDEPEL